MLRACKSDHFISPVTYPKFSRGSPNIIIHWKRSCQYHEQYWEPFCIECIIHDTPHSWHPTLMTPHCKQSWSVFIVISQLNRLNIKICLYTFPCFSVTWKQGYFNLFGNLTDQHRQVCWWWSVSCVVWASLVAIRPPLRCPPNRLLVDDLSLGTMILVTHQTCCYL